MYWLLIFKKYIFFYLKGGIIKKKFKALEKRFSEPLAVVSRELEVLKSLQKRMALDLQQSEIILNYLTSKYGEPEKKRAKFSSS